MDNEGFTKEMRKKKKGKKGCSSTYVGCYTKFLWNFYNCQ